MVTIPEALRPPELFRIEAEERRAPSPTIAPSVAPTITPTAPVETSEQRATRLAYDWVNRKLTGQKIVTAYHGQAGFTETDFDRARQIYTELRADPTIRRQVEQVTELKSEALAAGYTNVEKYIEDLSKRYQVERGLVEPRVVEGVIPPEVITPTPSPVAVPGERGVVYLPLEELERPGAVVPGLQPLRGLPEPVYIPLEELEKPGAIVPGKQPISVRPTERPFEPSTLYLGGKEIVTTLQPQFGTIIRSDYTGVAPWQRIDVRAEEIRPDLVVSLKQRITEYLPLGGTALALLDEPAYIRSAADAEAIKILLTSGRPGSAKELRVFLRKRQADLKKDLGRYKELEIKSQTEAGLTAAEFDESLKLLARINQGQRGTLYDIVYKATEEATSKGETVKILGKEVAPSTARLLVRAGAAAYQVQTDVLPFVIGGSIAGSLVTPGSFTSSLLVGAGKVSRYAAAPSALLLGGVKGFGELQRRGDIREALAVGVGTGAGLLSAIYAKEIFEGLGKGSAAVVRFLKGVGSDPLGGPLLTATGPVIRQKSKYDQEAYYKAIKTLMKKGYTESEARALIRNFGFEQLKEALRTSTKEEALKIVKQALKGLRDNPFLTAEQKRILAAQVAQTIIDVRPDFTTTQATQGVQYTAGSQSTETVKAFAKTEEAARSVFGEASIYAGLGLYERTGQQLVGRLQRPRTDQGLGQGLGFAEGLGQETEQTPGLLFGQPSALDTGQISQLIQPPVVTTPTPPIVTPTPPVQIPGFGFPTRPGRPRRPLEPPLPPPVGVPVGIPIPRPVKVIGPGELVNAYHGYVLVEGKEKRVTTKPHTKKGALDRIARIIDNTISAQGKVKPMKKKVEHGKLKKSDGYYNKVRNKFRGFKIIGGLQKPLKDTIIEKKEHRLDTRGETQRLTVAQFQARESKRARGLPVRKTKRRRTPFGF